jgi:carbamoyl-phosphate synthase small subunit
MKTGYLILEDKTVLKGTSFGAETDTQGEVVFNTGMVGYPESFTDPSYKGQILTLTYPLIGNYGIPSDSKDESGIKKYFESNNIHLNGILVAEYTEKPSHWNMKTTLSKWLKQNNIPALANIDTRALTQKLREKGTMLGKIIFDENGLKKAGGEFYDPNKENLVDMVSIKKPITYKRGRKKIVLIDCGCKNNIIRNLLKRNITVIRVPWNYDIFEHKIKFNGVLISNGPGDPMIVKKTHEIVKKCLRAKIPVFGICLGNQILAIAAGAKTYKLKYGHRAQNQPCMDLKTKKCYITSQNHGFAIQKKSLPAGWEPWFVNVNDKTIEGIRHKTKPFMAVQFHPEASPGPTDTSYLFDEFLKNL